MTSPNEPLSSSSLDSAAALSATSVGSDEGSSVSSAGNVPTWSGDNNDLSPAMKERYGVRPRSRGRLLATGLIVGVLVCLVFLVGWRLANPPVQARLITYHSASATQTDVTWEVSRSADAVVYCVLRGRDAQRRDVGYATVTVPAGSDYLQPTYSLTTLSKPAVVEVLGCDASAPLNVDGPAFGPGVFRPTQAPPGVAPTP